MTFRRIALWMAALVAAVVAGGLVALAALRLLELPPAEGVPLAALVEAVERKNLGAVRGIEYERDWGRMGGRFSGVWEFEVCREAACLKLALDARTGEEIRRDADDGERDLPRTPAASPSAIARAFEQKRLGIITEMEFDHGAWQVKFRESRGFVDALKPERRRVFELAPVSLKPRAPHRGRPLLLEVAG